MPAQTPSQPPWKRLIGRWLDALAVERGLSEHTVSAYRRDLGRLGRDLAERGEDLLTADAAALAAHLRALRRQGLAPRSVRRALSSIRGFYAHLVAEGERGDDPAVNLLPPRLLSQLPKVLGEREVEALLSAPDVTQPRGLRDRAMIELLYASGCASPSWSASSSAISRASPPTATAAARSTSCSSPARAPRSASCRSASRRSAGWSATSPRSARRSPAAATR
jgi:hypothetical protein